MLTKKALRKVNRAAKNRKNRNNEATTIEREIFRGTINH